MGICQTPEGRRIFSSLTVRENLEMGAILPQNWKTFDRNLERVYKLFPRLQERASQTGGTLSGGEQQMCAIARGLMARPRLLILDELSLGLAPIILDVLVDTLRKIHKEGTTIFLVEQDVATAFDLATTGYVLENGRVVLDGTADFLKNNEDVKEFYLGLSQVGKKKSYREVKHYRRRKRWLA
jgi:branched-chain amino acid transport system ATP-binding protein